MADGSAEHKWFLELSLEHEVILETEFGVLQVEPKLINKNLLSFVYSYRSEDGLYCESTPENPIPAFLFTPPARGRFELSVHAMAPDGTYEEGSMWITVEGVRNLDRPTVDENAPTAISVDDVSMVFNIANERYDSLKEYFIALMRHELTFKEFRALDHISFDVKKGEAFGLVGTNGSGKSTMLKVIAGVLDATEGSCQVHGSIAPLIELGAGFDLELTASENIYLNGSLLGYRKEFIDEHFQEIVDFAELDGFMEMPLKNYSSGMVARIAFSIATAAKPDVLIVDETLSVGDFLFQRKCEARIKEFVDSGDVTVLLVSHSIDLVERLCNRACWIEKGKLKMVGPTDEVCSKYKEYRR